MTDTPVSDPSDSTAGRPGMMKALYLWVLHWAETPYGTPALFALSFAESSFFPIPPDVLQIALSVSKPRRSFYYALVNGLGSVAGPTVQLPGGEEAGGFCGRNQAGAPRDGVIRR